ncbi:hypothetical protein WA026_010939 [Henosepilachna vigintioctopunctata]|uniref:Uncharacterized protein n=1 Tax=Henosepilachna vigintioctopunctata TaxID=420089 RepID=A0AAW1URK5_9CUCU
MGQNFLIKSSKKTDPRLKEEVFSRMRADKISLEAKQDFLICAFGSRYLKIHREKHFLLVEVKNDKAGEALELLEIDADNLAAYNTLLEIIFGRVILLNRKRPGELKQAEWNEVTRQLPSENPLRFEEFALVDEGVAVTGTMTDGDILDSLTIDEDAPSDEDYEEEEPADVTSKEARATVRTPSMFLEKTRDVPNSVFSSIVSFENMIDKLVANSFKQKKITDFFNY